MRCPLSRIQTGHEGHASLTSPVDCGADKCLRMAENLPLDIPLLISGGGCRRVLAKGLSPERLCSSFGRSWRHPLLLRGSSSLGRRRLHSRSYSGWQIRRRSIATGVIVSSARGISAILVRTVGQRDIIAQRTNGIPDQQASSAFVAYTFVLILANAVPHLTRVGTQR